MNKAMRQGLVYRAMGNMLLNHDRIPYPQHEYEEIGGTLWMMYHARSDQVKDRRSPIRPEERRALIYHTPSCLLLVFYDKKTKEYVGFHADVFEPLPPAPHPPEPQLLLPF